MTLTRRFLQSLQHPRHWRWGYLPLSYALLLVPFIANTFGQWGSAIATGCVDRCDTGWHNVWSLRRVAHAISHGTSLTHTDLLIHQAGVDLFWQTVMLAKPLVMAPIPPLFGRIVA